MCDGRRARFTRLWLIQLGRCALCGEKMPPLTTKNRRHPWTLEHVWPRRYGFITPGSVVLAHGRCNNRKDDRDPTGCELIFLAAVNAALGTEPTLKPGHFLDLINQLPPFAMAEAA